MNLKSHERSTTLMPWISFLVSLSIHFIAAIALAIVLIGTGAGGNGGLLLSIRALETDAEEVDLLTIEPDQIEVPLETVQDLPNIETSLDSSPESVMEESDVAVEFSRHDDIRRVASMRASLSREVSRSVGEAKTSFFGAEAFGNRFVFIVDSSGSMRGPRWEALKTELERVLKTLSPDQEFFIISFDTEPHPMFGLAPPEGDFLKPTKRSIERVKMWLRSLDLGSNTLPASALMMALYLKPDAIFLLSDGEIQDDTVQRLRLYNRKQTEDGRWQTLAPIHTILLHSLIGYQTLEFIANENNGTFTPVPFGAGN